LKGGIVNAPRTKGKISLGSVEVSSRTLGTQRCATATRERVFVERGAVSLLPRAQGPVTRPEKSSHMPFSSDRLVEHPTSEWEEEMAATKKALKASLRQPRPAVRPEETKVQNQAIQGLSTPGGTTRIANPSTTAGVRAGEEIDRRGNPHKV